MSQQQLDHVTEHRIGVAAPPSAVYAVIADATTWPHTFGPTVHAISESADDGSETLQLWALAGGEVRNWTSRRVHDPAARTIVFSQLVTSPPVTAMTGTWIVDPVQGDPNTSAVRLLHEFSVEDDDPAHVEWVETAVERNSTDELHALRVAAELDANQINATVHFADSVTIDAQVADVFAFLDRADAWAEHLPHVERVGFDEPSPGVQWLTLDTRAEDGSVHTTSSVRVTFPATSIVYKQTQVPAVLSAHTGAWTLRPLEGGVEVTSSHTIVVDPDKVHLLGAEATVATARDYVQAALSRNSRATLAVAKDRIEAARV
ncbi:aromatase/cyclase [Flexivirga aerilata]|uniref:aromatase/cyclase n=1 Tax=Flexivirga aerilata TaxID=1656889 RepID=UPI001BB109A5